MIAVDETRVIAHPAIAHARRHIIVKRLVVTGYDGIANLDSPRLKCRAGIVGNRRVIDLQSRTFINRRLSAEMSVDKAIAKNARTVLHINGRAIGFKVSILFVWIFVGIPRNHTVRHLGRSRILQIDSAAERTAVRHIPDISAVADDLAVQQLGGRGKQGDSTSTHRIVAFISGHIVGHNAI